LQIDVEAREPVETLGGFRASVSMLRRNRNFRRLYLASVISLGGDWFLLIALFGLMLDLTGQAIAVAFTIAAQDLTYFLASPFAGEGYRKDRTRLRRQHGEVDEPGEHPPARVVHAGELLLAVVGGGAGDDEVLDVVLVDELLCNLTHVLVEAVYVRLVFAEGRISVPRAATPRMRPGGLEIHLPEKPTTRPAAALRRIPYWGGDEEAELLGVYESNPV
jgi:hypothetical protein